MNIPEVCKQARKRCGVTQTQVAKNLHYTQSVISDFENGKNSNMYILLYYMRYFWYNSELITLLNLECMTDDIK